jgi:hypothetical protein
MDIKEKKNKQLGMHYGTAAQRLRKMIMFAMVKDLGLDNCFQCGKPIETVEELSIEHKVPWLDSEDPKGLFFDLENVAFSHLSCNCSAAYRKTWEERGIVHGVAGWRHGCRCKQCLHAKNEEKKSWRKSKKRREGR